MMIKPLAGDTGRQERVQPEADQRLPGYGRPHERTHGGRSLLLLTTTGARSGEARTTVLGYGSSRA